MWKKVVTFCVIIVALSAVFIISSSAIDLDSAIVDIDYSNGDVTDLKGKFALQNATGTPVSSSLVYGAERGIYSKAVDLSSISTDTVPVYKASSFATGTAFTIELYTKFVDGGASGCLNAFRLGYYNTTNLTRSYQMEVDNGKVTFWYTYKSGTDNYTNYGNAIVSSSKSYDVNQFHHIVFVVKSTGYYLYIDGELAGKNEDRPVESRNMRYLYPAGSENGGDFCARIRLFKSAATDEDVIQMYESFNKKVVCDFDFRSGSVVDDLTDTFSRHIFSGASWAHEDTMNSMDVYSSAVKTNGNTLQYKSVLDTAAFNKKFTIEYYAKFVNTSDVLSILTSAYPFEINGKKIVSWDSVAGGSSAIDSGSTLDLSKAHHVVLVGDTNMLYLYIDGVKVSEKSWTIIPRDFVDLNFDGDGAEYLMKFKVTSWAYTPDEVKAAYREILPEFNVDAKSLTLSNSIAVNFKVPSVLFKANTAGYAFTDMTISLNDDSTTIDYTEDGNYYVFTYKGVSPDEMNDTITVTLNGTLDGTATTGTTTYSVATYCYNVLANTSSETLKTLLVDMLNYGAAAQQYTGNTTSGLANADLTADQLAYGTQGDVTLTSAKDTVTDLDSATIAWKSAGLNLTDKVVMRFRIDAADTTNLTVKVTTADGKATWTIPASEFVANPDTTYGGYYVFFDNLNVANMRTVVYFTVYSGETAVSDTISYSIESYAALNQDSSNTALANLLQAMVKYGDATAAFVASN